MDAGQPLLSADVADRLERARRGEDEARRLAIRRLRTGDVGVLEAHVVQVGDTRSYNRRRGGTGLLCRVRLGDGTGEVDLVLWDDETRLVAGPLAFGQRVRLRGPTVKDGWKGGIELGLGACQIEALQEVEKRTRIVGHLDSIGDANIVGDPPDVRFNADAVVVTADGPVNVVLWDDVLKAARSVLPGAPISLDARPHPALEGWYIA